MIIPVKQSIRVKFNLLCFQAKRTGDVDLVAIMLLMNAVVRINYF